MTKTNLYSEKLCFKSAEVNGISRKNDRTEGNFCKNGRLSIPMRAEDSCLSLTNPVDLEDPDIITLI